MERKRLKSHEDLVVFQLAFGNAMSIFEFSKGFPKEERYSITGQIRRSSRSVCANLAEAWRRRRYQAAFIAKLNDCESEAAETQVWLKFAVQCQYLAPDDANPLHQRYNQIQSGIVTMINHPSKWLL